MSKLELETLKRIEKALPDKATRQTEMYKAMDDYFQKNGGKRMIKDAAKEASVEALSDIFDLDLTTIEGKRVVRITFASMENVNNELGEYGDRVRAVEIKQGGPRLNSKGPVIATMSTKKMLTLTLCSILFLGGFTMMVTGEAAVLLGGIRDFISPGK